MTPKGSFFMLCLPATPKTPCPKSIYLLGGQAPGAVRLQKGQLCKICPPRPKAKDSPALALTLGASQGDHPHPLTLPPELDRSLRRY